MQTQPPPGQAADLERLLTVVTKIKDGDFSVTAPSDLTGTAGQMARALNDHLEMLRKFSVEVHRITAEVGVVGRLGGQAEVDGVRGAWWGMVSSLNHMAGCLTEQVRNVSSAAHAASRGDSSAKAYCGCCLGEYEKLRDHVNALIESRRSPRPSAVAAPG